MNAQQILKELQSLNPQEPGDWPLYVRLAVVTLLGLFIVIGGYFYMVTPLLDQLASVQQEETALKQDFEAKQRKAAALDALKEQLAEMERSFGAMLRQLPSKAEIANLLIEISQTRLASSLEDELFKPEGETPKEFYAEVPNRITVTGTYHEMGTFVSGVAALPRIVTIEDIEIKPLVDTAAKGAKAGPKDQLRMNAVAKTYRYLDEEEITAAKPAAKTKGGARAPGSGP